MSCSPGNPCYKAPLEEGCGVDPCNNEIISSDNVNYTGPNLPCIGVDTCTNLTDTLSLISSKLCPDSLVLAFFASLSQNLPIVTETAANPCQPICGDSDSSNSFGPDNTIIVEQVDSQEVVWNFIETCLTTTTTANPCNCITFTNHDPVNNQYVLWDICPDVFSMPGYNIPPGSTFKACGSNPRTDAYPEGAVTWTIGEPCDKTNPYPTCAPTRCYTLLSSVEDLSSSTTITYYDVYGEFQTITETSDATNYICAQEGSIVVTNTGTGATIVEGGINHCTYDDECIPPPTTTSTTSSTTTLPPCSEYYICNVTGTSFIQYVPCGSTTPEIECVGDGECITVCANNSYPVTNLTGPTTITIQDECFTTTTTSTTIDCSNSGGTISRSGLTSVTITLNSPVSPNYGPIFNLIADVGAVTPGVVTQAQLLAGFTVSIDDAATQITIAPILSDCKLPLTLNIPALVPTRCTAIGYGIEGNPNAGYRIENLWIDDQLPNPPDGIYTFEIVDMILDGVSYGAGSTITITAPDDLVVGPGVINPGTYVMNINDWLNLIPGVPASDFVFYDNMSTIDCPDVTSEYSIVIKRTMPRTGSIQYYHYFKVFGGNTGWGLSALPIAPFDPTPCYSGCWGCSPIS